MSAPTQIRSTAGFRSLVLFELDANGLPIGALTLEASAPYSASGSVIGTSTCPVAAGVAVAGPVGYYGIAHSGARVLAINDPAPRVIPHIGDDGVFSLQVLPPLEPMTGELQIDKTNDIVDAIITATKSVEIGETYVFGEGTSKRGFEALVGALAYSAAKDTDPNSVLFNSDRWDFRIFPKANVFMRETGYGQEANVRTYAFSPMYCTAHIWGVQFTNAIEGYTRAQALRGVAQYKPVLVGFKGDATTVAFPFDSNKPAEAASKVTVWKDGVLCTTPAEYTASVRGVVFTAAPGNTSVVTVLYETT